MNYTFWRVFGGPGVIEVQLVNVVSRVLMQKYYTTLLRKGRSSPYHKKKQLSLIREEFLIIFSGVFHTGRLVRAFLEIPERIDVPSPSESRESRVALLVAGIVKIHQKSDTTTSTIIHRTDKKSTTPRSLHNRLTRVLLKGLKVKIRYNRFYYHQKRIPVLRIV